VTQTVGTATNLATQAGSFGATHIALTAALTGVLALAAAAWRLPRTAWPDVVAIGVLNAAAVFLWRMDSPAFRQRLARARGDLFLSLGICRSSVAQRSAALWPKPAIAVVISLVVNVVTI
jgi:hypothetical protein